MSEMRYFVAIRALGKFPVLPIDQDQFLNLKQSKLVLDNALAIEEKYEILLANFIEYERAILDVAVSESIGGAWDYGGYFDYRVAINTRMVNLLTSSRLYLDQLASNVTKIFNSKIEVSILISKLRAHEYEENEHYRFMEALRNYVQHAGLAVHHLDLGSGWIAEGDERALEFRTQVGADKLLLAEDKEFKQQVLQEIPDRVDLKLAARSYVESLGAIHLEVRKLVSELVEDARHAIQATFDQYSDLWAEQIVGLAALAMEGAKEVDFVPLLLEWDDVRLKLQAKNRGLANLRRRYVTSKCTPMKQPAKSSLGNL
jgi:hypothetical protein